MRQTIYLAFPPSFLPGSKSINTLPAINDDNAYQPAKIQGSGDTLPKDTKLNKKSVEVLLMRDLGMRFLKRLLTFASPREGRLGGPSFSWADTSPMT
jgi:hypothetical protein